MIWKWSKSEIIIWYFSLYSGWLLFFNNTVHFLFAMFSNVRSDLWFWVKLIIWSIRKHTNVLFQFFNFSIENRNLFSLKLIIFKDFLHWFIKNFVFISLLFDIWFELFVILSCFSVEFVLNNFCLLDENVHHDINFFPYLIGFLFEKLKIIISKNKGVLKHK